MSTTFADSGQYGNGFFTALSQKSAALGTIVPSATNCTNAVALKWCCDDALFSANDETQKSIEKLLSEVYYGVAGCGGKGGKPEGLGKKHSSSIGSSSSNSTAALTFDGLRCFASYSRGSLDSSTPGKRSTAGGKTTIDTTHPPFPPTQGEIDEFLGTQMNGTGTSPRQSDVVVATPVVTPPPTAIVRSPVYSLVHLDGVTPNRADGALDTARLKNHVLSFVTNGVIVYCCVGSPGRRKLLAFFASVVEVLASVTPLQAGIALNSDGVNGSTASSSGGKLVPNHVVILVIAPPGGPGTSSVSLDAIRSEIHNHLFKVEPTYDVSTGEHSEGAEWRNNVRVLLERAFLSFTTVVATSLAQDEQRVASVIYRLLGRSIPELSATTQHRVEKLSQRLLNVTVGSDIDVVAENELDWAEQTAAALFSREYTQWYNERRDTVGSAMVQAQFDKVTQQCVELLSCAACSGGDGVARTGGNTALSQKLVAAFTADAKRVLQRCQQEVEQRTSVTIEMGTTGVDTTGFGGRGGKQSVLRQQTRQIVEEGAPLAIASCLPKPLQFWLGTRQGLTVVAIMLFLILSAAVVS